MQALHMSGQAAEFRDPPPVRGPASGEVDNTEHPFMKLLAAIRNAIKQDSELDPDAVKAEHNQKSGPNSKKVKSLADSASQAGNGADGAEGGLIKNGFLRRDTGLPHDFGSSARSALDKPVQETDQKSFPGGEGSDLDKGLGKYLVSRTSQTGESGKTAKNRISEANQGISQTRNADLSEDTTKLQQSSLGAGKTQAGSGDGKTGSGIADGLDGKLETLARRSRIGSGADHDGRISASSAGLNGAANPAALNRNQNLTGNRDRGSVEDSVAGTKESSGRRPSRYFVVDMRLKAAAAKADAKGQADGMSPGKTGDQAPTEMNRSGIFNTDAAGRQIGNDQPAGGFLEASRGSGTEGGDKAPASFADNLAARLRDGGAMDIVRSAQIVLKDGDAGLIRLRLEPESLGGVKIELKMADKQISARIIVESDLAGEAFRSSLASLRDAFSSSGFETTSIEVEVRDGRAGSGDTGRDNAGNENEKNSELYMARKAGELGDAVPSADAVYGRYGVIDLVV